MKKLTTVLALLIIALPQAAIAQTAVEGTRTTNNGKTATIFWGLGIPDSTINLTVAALYDETRTAIPNTCGFVVFRPRSGESIISYTGHSGFNAYTPSTYAKPSAASVPACNASTPPVTAPFIAANGSLIFPSATATNAGMITQISRNIKIGKCGMIRYNHPAQSVNDSTQFSVGNFVSSNGDMVVKPAPICFKGILYKPLQSP